MSDEATARRALLFQQALYVEQGIGTAVDLKQAATAYRQAAELGCAFSMYRLAQLYESGLGVPSDEDQFNLWLKRAADAGHSTAMARYGELQTSGTKHITKDEKLGVEILEKAAAQGSWEAMRTLSERGYNNRDKPWGWPEALKWTQRGADAGDGEAATRFAVFVSQDAPACGVPNDRVLATKYLRKAARLRGQNLTSHFVHLSAPIFNVGGGALTPEAAAVTDSEMRRVLLANFLAGNWGNVTVPVWDENDRRVETGGLIVGNYEIQDGVMIEISLLHDPKRTSPQPFNIARVGEPLDPYRWDEYFLGS